MSLGKLVSIICINYNYVLIFSIRNTKHVGILPFTRITLLLFLSSWDLYLLYLFTLLVKLNFNNFSRDTPFWASKW